MSIDRNNQKYKKTSFLTGVNSDYIEEYYSLYLQNPKLLTSDWIEFFEGLNGEIRNLSYVPDQNFFGTDFFSLKVTDNYSSLVFNFYFDLFPRIYRMVHG